MKRTVEVTSYIEVEIDESKFTPEFMETFREGFFPFHTVDEHMEHLAQLRVRGLVHDFKPFAEGYGNLKEMGIRLSDPADDMETRVLPQPQHELK